MIEKTEFGILISYEEWEIIQEKLNNGTTSEVATLQQENKALKEVLNTMNSFLTEVEPWTNGRQHLTKKTSKYTTSNVTISNLMQSKDTLKQEATNMDPVRLNRKPAKKQPPIMEVLNKDLVIKIKFYALLIGAMALFIAFCFMIKGQTYGYL